MADDKALRVRSPNYPSISLPQAIEYASKIFKRLQTHPAPREVVLSAMSYKSYNGASASALSALIKYGLLYKIGSDFKLTERSLSIEHPRSEAEKAVAIKEALRAPTLWAELLDQFQGRLPDDSLLRATLLRKQFGASAVAPIINALRESVELAERFPTEYATIPVEKFDEEAATVIESEAAEHPVRKGGLNFLKNLKRNEPEVDGVRREIITLDEGDVVITFPEDLSAESFGDLKDHLDLFIKKMQRRAGRKPDFME